MIAFKVTPPVEEEVADVDGAEEVGGVTISVRGCFGRSWASLRLTIAAFMAHIMEKCEDSG